MNENSSNSPTVRPSTIEGIFYPAEKASLSNRLHDLLNHDENDRQPPGLPYGIIVPHAALDCCGEVATAAYRAVAARTVETAVLLGPVHREPAEALFLPESRLFQTPLGSTPVDEQVVGHLAGLSSSFRIDDIPHLEEHCLEVQLPFIQHLFPAAAIVPILLGKPIRSLVQLLARSLSGVYRAKLASTLFVVTANMSSNAPEQTGRKEAEQLIAWIDQGDWRSLIDAAERGRVSSCGAGCVAAILLMNRELEGTVRVLRQDSSLQMVKDPKKVVHYASFILKTDRQQVDEAATDG
jgi:AmmeMemoRadiSam system protein B